MLAGKDEQTELDPRLAYRLDAGWVELANGDPPHDSSERRVERLKGQPVRTHAPIVSVCCGRSPDRYGVEPEPTRAVGFMPFLAGRPEMAVTAKVAVR